jgi:membrane peptidoglycan carboxypeptidase
MRSYWIVRRFTANRRVDFKERKGEWVRLADISPAQTALILTEDKRF